MTPFELFFSLFGLILGLAMAVIIGGISDKLRERVPAKLGWGSPLSASWWIVMTALLLLPFRKIQLVGLAALLLNALVATVWSWS